MHRELLFFVCFSMPFNFVLLCINLVLFKVLLEALLCTLAVLCVFSG